MQRILTFAVALLVGVAIASEADATSFQLGDLSQTKKVLVISAFASDPPTLDVSDRFRFSLSKPAPGLKLDVDIQNDTIFDISELRLQLIGPGDTDIGPLLTRSVDFGTVYANLAIGNYFFRVRGDVNPGEGLLGYRYQLQAEVVPLPAALWLFLTAVGGLGIAGYCRNRLRSIAAN
jgi:hypothetical protein